MTKIEKNGRIFEVYCDNGILGFDISIYEIVRPNWIFFKDKLVHCTWYDKDEVLKEYKNVKEFAEKCVDDFLEEELKKIQHQEIMYVFFSARD